MGSDMSDLKKKTIDGIIAVEGGYVNDPNDSGGETNYGITIKVARENGYFGNMKDMPREVAVRIYETRYWDINRLSEIEMLSPRIAEELADTGVNMGVGRAGVFLQRSLNVLNQMGTHYPDIATDGKIGPGTIKALKDFLARRGKEGETVLYRMLNCLQGAGYVELAEKRVKDETFIFGWYKNRVS